MRTKIMTNNKEIYEALNNLSFKPEVEVAKHKGLTKIINNINKKNTIIALQTKQNSIIMKRISQPNYSIYFKHTSKKALAIGDLI